MAEVRIDPALPGVGRIEAESVNLRVTLSDGEETVVQVPVRPVPNAINLDFYIIPDQVREAVFRVFTFGPGHWQADVPVAALREEALRQVQAREVTWAELARRCEWFRVDRKNQPDGERFKRAIGVGRHAENTTVRAETARKVADALGVPPVELGF